MKNDSVNQWIDAGELRSLAESLLQPVTTEATEAPEEVYGAHFVGFTVAGPVDLGEATAQGRVRTVAMRSLSEARGKANEAGLVSAPESAPPVANFPGPKPVPETVTTRAAEELAATHHEPESQASGQPVQEAPTPAQVESPFRLAQEQPAQSASSAEIQHRRVVIPTPVAQAHPQVQPAQQTAIGTIPTASAPSGQPLARRMQAFGTWLKRSVPAEAFFVCDRNGEIISDEIGNEKLIKVARTLAHAASSAGRQVGDAGGLSSPFVKIGVDRVLQVIPKRSKFGLVVLGVIVPQVMGREAVSVIAQSLSKTLGDEVSVPV